MSTPHPSDEQLSAALDGEDPGALRHAERCDSCAARLEMLRSVAALVGSPVAGADPLVRERTIAVAVAAVEAGSAGLRGRLLAFPARRPAVLGIAAAVLLALVVVPLALRDGDSGHDVASKGLADETAARQQADFDAGDLGSLSDAQQLRAVVEPALGGFATGAGAVAGADDSGTEAGEAGPAAPSTVTSAGEEALVAAPSAQRAVTRSGTGAARQSALPCAAATTQTYGEGLGRLVYSATLHWQGTPAVVLGYTVPGASGPLDHRVFVVSRATCALLLVFSL